VEDTKNLMFFDFECTQDDGKHVPNLCVVHWERKRWRESLFWPKY
jgi:hypothetical protein